MHEIAHYGLLENFFFIRDWIMKINQHMSTVYCTELNLSAHMTVLFTLHFKQNACSWLLLCFWVWSTVNFKMYSCPVLIFFFFFLQQNFAASVHVIVRLSEKISYQNKVKLVGHQDMHADLTWKGPTYYEHKIAVGNVQENDALSPSLYCPIILPG